MCSNFDVIDKEIKAAVSRLDAISMELDCLLSRRGDKTLVSVTREGRVLIVNRGQLGAVVVEPSEAAELAKRIIEAAAKAGVRNGE